LNFYIVDVFAEEKYTGNQLAIFRGAQSMSDKEMQRLAKEMNYSETTFIMAEEARPAINGGNQLGYEVRIFTPTAEVPFAGHPTLGTAYLIQREIIKQSVETVVLNLQAGQIPVTLNYKNGNPDILWMRQLPPQFGKTFDPTDIAPLLSLDRFAIDDKFPIQEVSTGLPFIIVPLRTLNSIKQCHINQERLAAFERSQPKAFLVFCPETYHLQNDLNVRMFGDDYGVPEDPATGSGNGCLAGYLVQHHYYETNSIDIRVEQGYEIGRPSLLLLKAQKENDQIKVSVGGKVIMVAKGELI